MINPQTIRTTLSFPNEMPPTVKANKDKLLQHFREVDFSPSYSDARAEGLAKKLYALGISEVQNIVVIENDSILDQVNYDENNKFRLILFSDSHGAPYHMMMNSVGDYQFIIRGNWRDSDNRQVLYTVQ